MFGLPKITGFGQNISDPNECGPNDRLDHLADATSDDLVQFGPGQYAPDGCVEDSRAVPPTSKCDVRLIDSRGEMIEGLPCAEEFFARALSHRARSKTFTVGTTAVLIRFNQKFNRVTLINDHATAKLAISFSEGGVPAAGLTAVALASNSRFDDSQCVNPEESRVFEIWSDTIQIVADTLSTTGRITIYFP